MLLIRRLARG